MTMIDLLAAAGSGAGTIAPTRLDPVELFLMADIVVQTVMVGLLLASVWVWMIIVSFSMRMGKLGKATTAFETEFWQADDPETLISRSKGDIPAGRVAGAGLAEFRRSAKKGIRDKNATLARIALAMEGQVAAEADKLSERLTFLASTGAVAPFVGLFGTVWGIMNSFFQIGQQNNSSLAVVAPGISEALFATAIGLFAAIPAVIAYNRFSNDVGRFEARLQRFADKVHAQVSREMEAG
ncbi:protein TolQ [Altererythrobacter lauratis]|uniref:Protein TolQ n=1 Tax=Alteraurantiacibacter lauratis TaxID=2054627 RepID=A0ABV7EGZ3_9SPHN